MWKILSTAALLGAPLTSTFGSPAEARSQARIRTIGVVKIARVEAPIIVEKPMFVKPIISQKHWGYRPVLFVTAGYGACDFAYRKWQITGLNYWKNHYFNCTGHY